MDSHVRLGVGSSVKDLSDMRKPSISLGSGIVKSGATVPRGPRRELYCPSQE
jgi:hypothetical protein